MIDLHKVLLWTAVAARSLLPFKLRRVQAAKASNFGTINFEQSLPPMSNLRLRFTGSPGQRYTIERASAMTGPWTKITTRTAPSSSLLR